MENSSPGLPSFDYIKPNSMTDASQFLSAHPGEARPLLGGTDIFVRMRDGHWHDRYLIDLKDLPGMKQLSYDPQKGLSIGAAVSMNALTAFGPAQKYYSVLVQAAQSVASYPLRNRATIVGNICNASPAADTTGACLLLDGELEVFSGESTHRQALCSFFTAPGETLLQPSDIVTRLILPPPPQGLVGVYIKLGRNKASDLAIVGVTAIGYPDHNNPSGFHCRLALASVAPTPLVVHAVEDYLARAPFVEASFHQAAQIAMQACAPIDDTRSSAKYRSLMVRNLAYQALEQICTELTGRINHGGIDG
jgi:CO/xanthine dehydrogenase FAD-binding subunit